MTSSGSCLSRSVLEHILTVQGSASAALLAVSCPASLTAAKAGAKGASTLRAHKHTPLLTTYHIGELVQQLKGMAANLEISSFLMPNMVHLVKELTSV